MSATIKYGLFFALTGVLLSLIGYFLGDGLGQGPLGWISAAVVLGAFVYLNLLLKGETMGAISYGRGFGMAFTMGLIYCLLLPSFEYVKFNFIDPSLNEQLREKILEQNEKAISDLEDQGSPDEQIEIVESWGNWSADTFGTFGVLMFGMSLGSTLFANLIFSLLVAIFMRRSEDDSVGDISEIGDNATE